MSTVESWAKIGLDHGVLMCVLYREAVISTAWHRQAGVWLQRLWVDVRGSGPDPNRSVATAALRRNECKSDHLMGCLWHVTNSSLSNLASPAISEQTFPIFYKKAFKCHFLIFFFFFN